MSHAPTSPRDEANVDLGPDSAVASLVITPQDDDDIDDEGYILGSPLDWLPLLKAPTDMARQKHRPTCLPSSLPSGAV